MWTLKSLEIDWLFIWNLVDEENFCVHVPLWLSGSKLSLNLKKVASCCNFGPQSSESICTFWFLSTVELGNKDFFLFLNAKYSLSLCIKLAIGHWKWFLNTNLFLIKLFLIPSLTYYTYIAQDIPTTLNSENLYHFFSYGTKSDLVGFVSFQW